MEYPGGASAYAIPFPYLSRAHVVVLVDNLAFGGTITFNSAVSISLSPNPTAGQTVRVKRVTPRDQDYVEFNNPLTEQDATRAKLQALYLIQELEDGAIGDGGGGGGGGGSVAWSSVTGKPAIVTNFAALEGAAGKLIRFTGTDTFELVDPLAAVASKPVLLSAFGATDTTGLAIGGNDTTFAAAEADLNEVAIYIPEGEYLKTKGTTYPGDNLTKAYEGRGQILEDWSGVLNRLPAKFRFMGVTPAVGPNSGTGVTGWFGGDQRFTNGGEYFVIGPEARTWDPEHIYFASTAIPKHAWFDVRGGASGINAFLTSGAAAGATVIPLPAPAQASWVGKEVAFANAPDGGAGPVVIRTVTAVNTAGNNITIDSPTGVTYTWNPGAGLLPCIYFGKRTWHGFAYRRINGYGKGDVYGHLVRTNGHYQPAPTEDHTFMTQTTGQYGGDQYLHADGLYMTGWESQQYDKPGATSYDVAAIGFVQSQVRTKDYALDGGKFWAMTFFKSEGTRPIDVCHGIAGRVRNGVDMVKAFLYETTRLVAPTTASGTTISVKTTNGAHPGDPIYIGEPGAAVYSGTIASISGTTITVTPALPGSVIPTDTLVTFDRGGAALNLKHYQRIVWNSADSVSQRGGDPLGRYATFYGNDQGDLIMEAGEDGTSEYWTVRFANPAGTNSLPDIARLRMRRNGSIQAYTGPAVGGTGTFQASRSVEAALELVTNSSSFNGRPAVVFGAGLGVWIEWNGVNLRATKNGGAGFTNIV